MPNTPEYKKRYYRLNPEKFKEYRRRYKDTVRRWYKKNRKAIQARRRAQDFQRRLELIARLGGKCQRCEVTDYRMLQIDHKRNNGNKERRKLCGRNRGMGMYQYKILMKVRAGSQDYQLLCANHNWLKRYE